MTLVATLQSCVTRLSLNLEPNISICFAHRCTHRQVFVANPNKTQPIIDILAGNKDKLLRYLADFHSDKSAPSGLCSTLGRLLLVTPYRGSAMYTFWSPLYHSVFAVARSLQLLTSCVALSYLFAHLLLSR